MENADEAKKAVEALNESDFDGNTLSVQVRLSIIIIIMHLLRAIRPGKKPDDNQYKVNIKISKYAQQLRTSLK